MDEGRVRTAEGSCLGEKKKSAQVRGRYAHVGGSV
jgi:hypothetical protein